MDPHWHAFAYSGSRPTDAQGMDPASPYASPETVFWLRKPQLLASVWRALRRSLTCCLWLRTVGATKQTQRWTSWRNASAPSSVGKPRCPQRC